MKKFLFMGILLLFLSPLYNAFGCQEFFYNGNYVNGCASSKKDENFYQSFNSKITYASTGISHKINETRDDLYFIQAKYGSFATWAIIFLVILGCLVLFVLAVKAIFNIKAYFKNKKFL
jgi:hypothetical protein